MTASTVIAQRHITIPFFGTSIILFFPITVRGVFFGYPYNLQLDSGWFFGISIKSSAGHSGATSHFSYIFFERVNVHKLIYWARVALLYCQAWGFFWGVPLLDIYTFIYWAQGGGPIAKLIYLFCIENRVIVLKIHLLAAGILAILPGVVNF